jgi:hypothetical protein
MFETEEAKRFFAAWQAMRTGDALPHYRTVFQHLPNDLLPRIMIIEQMTLESYIARFMGTRFAELWHQDLTGQDAFSAASPKVAAAARRNVTHVLTKPCGIVTVGSFSLRVRTELALETVSLPVTNDPGRPARTVTFVQEIIRPLSRSEDRPDVAQRQWIDLGFGVPAAKPAQ